MNQPLSWSILHASFMHSDSDAFIVNEWPPSLPMRHLGLIALLPGHLSGCTASQGNFNRCTWLVSYHWQGSLGFKELLCRMTRQWRKRQDHEDQSTKAALRSLSISTGRTPEDLYRHHIQYVHSISTLQVKNTAFWNVSAKTHQL